MRFESRTIATVLAAALLTVAGGSMAADESPAEIIKARHEKLKDLGTQAKAIGGQLKSGTLDRAIMTDAAKKIAAVAEAAGLGCVLGTAFAVGPELAAKLHLASSIPIVVDAVEFTELSLHGTVLAPPFDTLFGLPLEDGCLPVPTGPGLGVELDPASVERHTYGGR